jgi:sulfide dehydrogenase cytochrome subunit
MHNEPTQPVAAVWQRAVLWSAAVGLAATAAVTVLTEALAPRATAATATNSLPASAPAAATAATAAEAVPAETMAHSCAACHGTNGQLGDEYFKPLAGMPAEQFVATMIDFREGRRPATLMGHVARGFSDADLHAMAAFFAAQRPLAHAGDAPKGGH